MMTFQEKSTLAMTGILLLVFGSYFTLVFTVIAASPGRDLAFTGLMVGAVVMLVILAAASHIVLAVAFRHGTTVGRMMRSVHHAAR
jgi:multisubunit Na+/H+ antiporter MnhB subunit